jgi:hypothetical protein
MKNRVNRLVSQVVVAVTMTSLLVGSLAACTNQRLQARLTDRRDRGALSLEQAIVTAVLSAAAIALGVVIVNAITSHSAQIR